MAEEIVPGDEPSYQLCKTILTYHPLGAKIAEGPIKMAQCQDRLVDVPGHPDAVKEAFVGEFLRMGVTRKVRNLMKTARAYGIGSVVAKERDKDGQPVDPATPLEPAKLAERDIKFDVFDPLNTAGSLVLNQDPNAWDYQKPLREEVRASGVTYHRSRCCIVLNEEPVYILYTTSAFGFVGRSVYQRALYPLKSFVQTMITDDLVTLKVGVFVAKIKQVTSATNNLIKGLIGLKRDVVKEAIVGNVISITPEEDIETLNMQNMDGPYALARNNILKNIATAIDAPAKFMDQETMVEGFGEGTEDAKNFARYIGGIRDDMAPAYAFFDPIVMRRAWGPAFFATQQKLHPERYGSREYEDVFTEWRNAFVAPWPSLLIEPESEKAKAEQERLKALLEVIAGLATMLDPENKARLLAWVAETINSIKTLFPAPLELDIDDLLEYASRAGAFGEGEEEDEEGGDEEPGKGNVARLPPPRKKAADA